jgi:hypothetical protein
MGRVFFLEISADPSHFLWPSCDTFLWATRFFKK